MTANPETFEGNVPGPVVLYDGECGLCLSSIMFVLRHERGAETLRFSPLQSNAARTMLGLSEDDPLPLHSIFLIEPSTAEPLEKSDAALRVASYLHAPWSWARCFSWVPRAIRDRVYDSVARRRYHFFGCAADEAKARLETAYSGRILR